PGETATPRLLQLAAVRALPARRRLHRPGAAAAAQPRHVRPRPRLDRPAPRPRREVPDRAGAHHLRGRGPQATAPHRLAARLSRARARAGAVVAVSVDAARAAREEARRLRVDSQGLSGVVPVASPWSR